MSSDITYPFIIIIFCLIFIYGIIKLQQNNKLIKAIENFSNEKNIKQNLLNNINITSDIANGTWTSLNTTVDSDYNVNNLTNIQINNSVLDSNKIIADNNSVPLGTIQTYVPNNLNSITTFNITNLLNGILLGSTSDNVYNIEIKFIGLFDNNNKNINGYYPTNTPTAMVSLYSQNTLVTKYMTYKVYDNKVGAELYRIISVQDFYIDSPPPIYDFQTYDIIVNSYKFPNNFISFGFGEMNDSILNIIKTKYNGKLKLCIKRVFISPSGATFTSNISQSIKLNAIYNNNQIPKFIQIVSFEKDRNLNNFKKIYKLVQTNVYLYKFTNINTTYDFKDKNFITNDKTVFNLQNNANSMFKKNIKFNNLKSVSQFNDINYTLTLLTTVNSNMTDPTIIQFSSISNLL